VVFCCNIWCLCRWICLTSVISVFRTGISMASKSRSLKFVNSFAVRVNTCLTSRQHRLTSIWILCRITFPCPCFNFAQHMIIWSVGDKFYRNPLSVHTTRNKYWWHETDGQGKNTMPQLRPHSIILASWKPGCKPGFRPGLQPGFRQVRAGLRHAFDRLSTGFRLFCRKPGREPAASISTCRDWCSRFAAVSLVRVRARQMKCRKTRFEPANEPVEGGFSLRIYYSCLSWRN